MHLEKLTVAMAGNPNAGKTTIFNALTGEREHVGNYPGVTVEKKVGKGKHKGREIIFVDLPGTYSLTAYSVEEMVARDFLVGERPDVVVHVLDASNLERNLYLTVQLIELGLPLVLDFNMTDMARAQGFEMDLERLSQLLGAPIVSTVGSREEGIEALLDAIVEVGEGSRRYPAVEVKYGREIEEEVEKLALLVREEEPALSECYGARWVALKLLESDQEVSAATASPKVKASVQSSIAHIEVIFRDSPEMVVAERRYGFISGICQETVLNTTEIRHTRSDQIDEIVTHRALGLPLFLGIMYLVFLLTFSLGEPGMVLIENFFGWLSKGAISLFPDTIPSWIQSLMVDGILGGVGGVLVFLPNILLLFLAITLLEDSGYMARAAFIMDRYMHRMGLHGKSFIPMLLGFGCSVPAILSTRTLESRRDRLTTMMVIPLMSCGARIPIYTLFIPAFFPVSWRAPILWILYLIGVILAGVLAKFLRKTLFRGETTPLAMELPPYRMPTLKGAWIHMWERGWLYVKKAGTVILVASVLLWILISFPVKPLDETEIERELTGAYTAFLERARHIGDQLESVPCGTVLEKMAQAQIEAIQGCSLGDIPDSIHTSLSELRQREEDPLLYALLEAREVVLYFREHLHGGGISSNRERSMSKIDPRLYGTAVRFVDEAERPFLSEVKDIRVRNASQKMSNTWAGRIGRGMEPVSRPLGFDWKINTALIGAFAAKELFVAQMSIVYAVEEENADSDRLRSRLREDYSPLVALCIMLFCLISTPCIATLAATRMESGSWVWPGLQWGGLTMLAYVVVFLVYQLGSFLGLGLAPV